MFATHFSGLHFFRSLPESEVRAVGSCSVSPLVFYCWNQCTSLCVSVSVCVSVCGHVCVCVCVCVCV